VLPSRARSSVSGPSDVSLHSPGGRHSLRRPELAASAPDRPAVHRALRLVIAAGTAAAGVCLVLAMTVLAVQLGAAGVARSASSRPIVAAQSGSSEASRGGPRPTASAGPASSWIAGPAIATFHGTGPARNDQFAVREPGSWGLSWKFSCSARQSGGIRLTAKGTVAGHHVVLDAAGPSGRGVTWNTRDAGIHILDVSTSCSWTATVILPKSADRPPASG
jgi:hypothetical protein